MEEENKFIALLSKHWSKFLLALLAVASIAAWTERLLNKSDSQNKQDFATVNQIFEQFQKGQYLSSASIEIAENILARHPELHPKYDAMLALTFLSQAETTEGLKYAQSLTKQVDSELPMFYKNYAQTSLLISSENYSEAFTRSLALQEELKENSGYPTLDAMNTLRILFLADRLGDRTHKDASWQKLQHHPAYPTIQTLFHEGTLSLADYVSKK